TRLHLVQEGFDLSSELGLQAFRGMGDGWSNVLSRLERLLTEGGRLMSGSNRIEKTILLRAPTARVWRALTDAEEFGAWFRVKLHSDFAVGRKVTGRITY